MDVGQNHPVGDGRGSPRDPAPKPTAPRPTAETTGLNTTVQVPKNGGPSPSTRNERQKERRKSPDDESDPKDHKDRKVAADAVLAAIRMRADVNLATDVRIEVDLQDTEPKFLVVSRETGEVLRIISKEDTKKILHEVPEASGLLLDDRG